MSSARCFAGVAQLAEHDVANVVVEGSNPSPALGQGFSLNGVFSGFGHGFRSKQLVPEHLLASDFIISRRAYVFGARFLRASCFNAAFCLSFENVQVFEPLFFLRVWREILEAQFCLDHGDVL